MTRFLALGPVRFAREMVGLYFEKHVARAAAALVYWLILSLFPLLICVNAFVASLELDPAAVLGTLEPIMPAGMLGVVEDYLGYVTGHESPALLVVGAVTTVFFASAAVRGLMDITDELYGQPGYTGLRRLGVSVGFSLLLLAGIYLSLVVVLTGSRFFRSLGQRLGLWWLTGLLDLPWLKFLLLFGVAFVFITLIYLAATPPGQARGPATRGGALASVALVAASAVFSGFIGMSSRYSLIYGSLASVIILLLWLYLCANVLILGQVFNRVWDGWKKQKKIENNP